MSSSPVTPPDRRAHAADLELVARARRGDARALAELTERLSCVPAMLRDRHRRVGQPLRPEELSEVEQETLAALWDKLAIFEGRATIETWAYRFVVLELHKGLERRRRQRRFVPDGESEIIVRAQPEAAELAIDPAALHAEIERVGSPSSEIIRMRHFEDLSFDEIAAHTGEPVNTVKARYYRGLERLRTLLGPTLRRSMR
jgi:RNA polymerase sigma factor (sigma-70 family)